MELIRIWECKSIQMGTLWGRISSIFRRGKQVLWTRAKCMCANILTFPSVVSSPLIHFWKVWSYVILVDALGCAVASVVEFVYSPDLIFCVCMRLQCLGKWRKVWKHHGNSRGNSRTLCLCVVFSQLGLCCTEDEQMSCLNHTLLFWITVELLLNYWLWC